MTKWKVLKVTDSDSPVVFMHVGEIESRFHYSPPGVQEIGEAFGVGSFVLLGIGEGLDSSTWREITIAQDTPTFVETVNEVAA
jgi:hypothetical protein